MARNPPRNPLGSARPSSARALLLVMIGEFVWPTGQPAWSSTLISGLAEFGIEPNAARKALQRIAATGITTGTPSSRPADPPPVAAARTS